MPTSKRRKLTGGESENIVAAYELVQSSGRAMRGPETSSPAVLAAERLKLYDELTGERNQILTAHHPLYIALVDSLHTDKGCNHCDKVREFERLSSRLAEIDSQLRQLMAAER